MKTTRSSLTGRQKAAIVIMELGIERASTILRHVSKDEAAGIAAEIANNTKVSSERSEEVLKEFHALVVSGRSAVRGGREFAEGLLHSTYGDDGDDAVNRMASTMAGKSFEFLEEADPAQVASLLESERPQTAALVIGHLSKTTQATVTGLLPEGLRGEVAYALVTMRVPTPEAVTLVAASLKRRAGSAVTPRSQVEEVGGVQPLVDIVNRSTPTVEKQIMEALQARDPEMADEVRARMFTFDDLIKLDGRELQMVLRGVSMSVLAVAIRGAKPALVEQFTVNLTEKNTELLREEGEALTKVLRSEVEEARAVMVSRVRELESEGTLTLERDSDYA
jgi:flagellar motor switch protein FliG